MGSRGISLRYKLLAALTVIPVVGLSLFLLLAKNIFEKDKIAYIYDSSRSSSANFAARISSEIDSMIGVTRAVVLGYRADTRDLSETGLQYFDRERKLEALRIYALDLDKSYQTTVDLKKESAAGVFDQMPDVLSKLLASMGQTEIFVAKVPGEIPRMLLAARFGSVTDPKHVIAVALVDAEDLNNAFSLRSSQGVRLVVRDDGTPVLVPGEELEPRWDAGTIWRHVGADKRKAPEGTTELVSPSGIRYLVSYVHVGVGNLVVVSLTDRQTALAAINILIQKSFLFFIAILSATAIFAVIASRGLTSALGRLSEATTRISGGDFTTRVAIKAGGEIGILVESFNKMAGEIARLVRETAEKARMENELATARTVQETLFPSATAEIGPVQISGLYLSASECGGDWWYYCENGDKVYIWIGDATGHGAPAALITSAARAVASVIESGPPIPVSVALRLLNRAINDTSKGKMMMTFFLAAIDKATGEFTFSNASHELPLILHRKEDGSYRRDDFETVEGINNPRLGERPDFEFRESSIQLQPGDKLIFYTDGLVDVKDRSSNTFGERRFLKALATEASQSEENGAIIGGVVEHIEEFKGAEPLPDDVTLVLCTYKGAA
jgi:sigma-B regulation protein RsbU (phosphoserine phosphatase)